MTSLMPSVIRNPNSSMVLGQWQSPGSFSTQMKIFPSSRKMIAALGPAA